jgi:hypothetical protein
VSKHERDLVENPTKAWAKDHGILTLKLNLMGNTGWPDDEFLHAGRMVLIEFKAPGEDLERNQPERIDELVRRGFTVGVFDDTWRAIHFLEATLLSEAWRKADDLPGVCWIALQTRFGKDLCRLYGEPYFAGETVRRKDLRYLPDSPDV